MVLRRINYLLSSTVSSALLTAHGVRLAADEALGAPLCVLAVVMSVNTFSSATLDNRLYWLSETHSKQCQLITSHNVTRSLPIGIPEHYHHFPGLSMTFAAFHDFPSLENGPPKFHNFPGPVGTLSRRNLPSFRHFKARKLSGEGSCPWNTLGVLPQNNETMQIYR